MSDEREDISIKHRLSELEKERRNLWREINSMQTELKERMASLEAEVRGVCRRLDRVAGHSGNGVTGYLSDSSRRFERLWGVLQFAGWITFIVLVATGTVITVMQFMQGV